MGCLGSEAIVYIAVHCVVINLLVWTYLQGSCWVSCKSGL